MASVSNFTDRTVGGKITLKYYNDTGNMTNNDGFFVVTFSNCDGNVMSFKLNRYMFNSDYTSLSDSALYYQSNQVRIKPAYNYEWNITMLRADDNHKPTTMRLKEADVYSLIQLYDQLQVKIGNESIFPPKPVVVKDVEINLTEGNNNNIETEGNVSDDNVNDTSTSSKYDKLITYLISEAKSNYNTKTALSLFLETVEDEEYKDLLEVFVNKIVSSKQIV
jgi:hypothetical protein